MDMRHITADRLVDSTNGAALLELLELLERQVDVVEPFTEQPWEDVCTRADPERVRRAAELAAQNWSTDCEVRGCAGFSG